MTDASDVSITTAVREYLKQKHPGGGGFQCIRWCGEVPQIDAALWECLSMVCVCDMMGTPLIISP